MIDTVTVMTEDKSTDTQVRKDKKVSLYSGRGLSFSLKGDTALGKNKKKANRMREFKI